MKKVNKCKRNPSIFGYKESHHLTSRKTFSDNKSGAIVVARVACCSPLAHISVSLVMASMLGSQSKSGKSLSVKVQVVPVVNSMSPFVGLLR